MNRRWTALLIFAAMSCGPRTDIGLGADGGIDAGDTAPDAAPTSDLGPTPDLGPGGDVSAPAVDMSGAVPDAGGSADGGAQDAGVSSGFAVPATAGSYDVDFTIAIDGSANGPVGAISVAGGAGTVELNGRSVPVGLYQRQPWEEFGYTLYQGIAVDQDRWWVLWFYCQGSTLTNVYYQGTAGPALATVPATGSCDGTASASSVSVDFPASTVRVEPLQERFTVTGPNLEISPGVPGVLRDGGRTFDVHAFGLVDCTTECGADGWHEIHAVLRDPVTDETCFGIFYLYEDMRYIQVSYAFSLPSLTDPLQGSVRIDDASWSE